MNQYRKDVQMLRGAAVALVVLFHLGIGGFQSGFLGVDVFFVISGYLMAVLYRPADKQDFFARRARRLLPAYFATVLATVVAASLLVTPNDFGQVATQATFASVFSSNVGFWLENSYFDKAAFKPLLHLWSLGVEIQFYLLLPAFAWLFGRTRLAGLLLVAACSALVCFVVVQVSPKTSFFLLPFRLWEFLIGYAVARHTPAVARRHRAARAIGLVGLIVLLCIPTIKVDGEARTFLTGHPGVAAVLVSFATSMVLAFGLPAAVLRWRLATALERLGDWSYSLYLAHFPIIVLGLYKPFSGTVLSGATPSRLALIVASMAVATTILHRFVEQPLRKARFTKIHLALAMTSVVIVTVGFGYLKSMLLPSEERLIYAAWSDRAHYRCGKLVRVLHPTDLTCELDYLSRPEHRVLLVGNSHADSIKASFSEVAATHGLAVHFVVDNLPLLPGGMTSHRLVEEAVRLRVRAIVLHYSANSIAARAMDELINLASAHGILVSFIMPVPHWSEHVPRMLWAHRKLGTPLQTQSRREYEASVADTSDSLPPLQAKGLRVYQVADILCEPDCRLLDGSGRPLYFDHHHLTLSGSALLKPVFEAVAKDVMRHGPPPSAPVP